MNHLTFEEIMDFVSFKELNSNSISLASKVNAHILKCVECRKKVREYQTVFDRLSSFNEENDFSEYIDEDTMKAPNKDDGMLLDN